MFEEALPLEIKFQILLYCTDDVLFHFGLTNHFYNHLIFKINNSALINDNNEDNNEMLDNYNKLLWNNRCKDILNKYIDDYNNEIIKNNLDLSILLNIDTDNQLQQYFKNNIINKNINIIEMYKIIKNLKFELHLNNKFDEKSFSLQKNKCRNINLYTWFSFYGNLKLNIMKGFEITINEYYNCGNGWKIAIGFGLKTNEFNSDRGIAEYTSNNKGIGLILESCGFKKSGYWQNSLHNYSPPKVGYRYTVYLDWDVNKCVYFLQNGKVITKAQLDGELKLEKDEIYPIISMTTQKSCTIYPLLSENYDPIRLEEECKLLSVCNENNNDF
ncbi:hypothetical protein ABK040_011534 [Willaertia magna]